MYPANLHVRFSTPFSPISGSSLVSDLFSYLESVLRPVPPTSPTLPIRPRSYRDYFCKVTCPRKPTKKALLIGIKSSPPAGIEDQAYDDSDESDLSSSEDSSDDELGGKSRSNKDGILSGPHNDVNMMKELLIKFYGYKEEDMIVMLDRDDLPTEYEKLRPTRANIIRCIKEMVKDAKSEDRFFFQFAGHSTQKECPESPNEEEDGQDEYICTSDGQLIRDNLLKKLLVDPLPLGTTLTTILDTCHSGTLLDLPHTKCNGSSVGPSLSLEARSPSASQNKFILCDGLCRTRNTHATVRGSNVICLSAAMDNQFAWEGRRKSKIGSMTQCLIKVLTKEKHPNLHYLRDKLRLQSISFWVKII
ncbi:caspase domain-containing protein [Cyathus striatus]|nr:caspase domain-containing protein [Cyathus striatus]